MEAELYKTSRLSKYHGIGGEKVPMAALELKTGKTVWELPNAESLKMSHASVLSARLLRLRKGVLQALDRLVHQGI